MKRMAKVLAYVLSASMVMQTPVNVVQAAEADDTSSTTIVADLTSEDAAIIEDGEENGEPEVAPIADPVGEIGEPETEPAPEADPEPETEPIAPVVEPTAAPVVDPIEEPEKEIETPDPEETIIVIDDPEIDAQDGNYTFTVNNALEVTITGYSGDAANVQIPSFLDGHEVVAIGDGVFNGHTEITSVTMPDTIRTIGNTTFYNCSGLASIHLSTGLTSVGNRCFWNCINLKELLIPASLEYGAHWSTGQGPFYNCPSLSKITLADGMEKVGSCLLEGCDGLSEIVIPNTVTLIKADAFRGCPNLKKVTFSENLLTIDSYAFSDCPQLNNLVLPDSLKIIEEQAFTGCTGLTAVTVPDSVTAIGRFAFAGCTALAEVNLSENLEAIGERTFDSCTKLTEIVIPAKLESAAHWSTGQGPFYKCSNLKKVILAEGMVRVANCLLEGCDGIEEIVIPNTVTEIKRDAFRACPNLKKVTFSDHLQLINAYAFSDSTVLTNVELPDSLEIIEESAFNNCDGLIEITIPNAVTAIGRFAFCDCSALSSVNLSENLVGLGERSFDSCKKLTEIVIPAKLESAAHWSTGQGPFYRCSNLKKVTLAEGMARVANCLLEGCDGIEEIVIPNTVTEIKADAFRECPNLKKVTFSDNMLLIGKYAFANSVQLDGLNLPDSLMTIDDSAFAGCNGLTSVSIPDSVTSIGQFAFANCSALSSLKLPKNLQGMGARSFESCTRLTEVVIPAGFENAAHYNAGEGPFYKCSNLKKVILEEGMVRVANCLLEGCDGIEEIVIPSSVVEIKNDAFRNCANLQKVVFSKNLKIIGVSAFNSCPVLDNIVIPSGVTTLPNNAFSGCTSLAHLQLHNDLTSFGDYCFQGIAVESLEIPNSVTYIGDYAFRNCEQLTNVKLSNRLQSIRMQIFANCKSLTSFTIPDSVTSINWTAISGCDNLAEIKVGTGITEIAASAFKDRKELKNVIFTNRLKKIGSQAFVNDVYLTEIYIPQSVTSIADDAFSYPGRLIIYGVAGSYAETYAKSIGAKFVAREIHIEKIEPESSEITLNKGQKYTIPVTITPANYTDILSWKTADTAIVTVDDRGTVTAQAVGTANVKVLGDNVSTSIKINVVQPMTAINLNTTAVTLEGGASYQLVATPYPANAINQDIVWYSENPEIADVDENGKVTAYLKGVTKIVAAAADGSGVTKACTVTVNNTCIKVKSLRDFASPHGYKDNCTDKWRLDIDGAETIAITFDARTEMESGFDYIKLYNGANELLGTYTGTELAGERIVIEGSAVIVQIVSDDSGHDWGFAVTKIEQVAPEVEGLSIVTQPVSANCEENEEAVYTVETTGTGVTYQWQSSTDGNNWTDLTVAQGAVENNLTLTATLERDQLYIRCNVEDIFGNVETTDTVRLIVNVPLAITTQPKSITVQTGDVAKFSVVATGKSLRYAWTYSTDNGATWKASTSASASTATFSITAAEKWNGMLLRCTVTDSDGNSETTSTAKLTVPITSKPVITGQPVSATVNEGEKASFTVTATGTGLTYQWYYSTDNGTTFQKSTASSATTKTFSITSAAKWNGMQLKCVVTNAGGISVTTNTVKLNVKLALAITAQPKSVTANVGDKASFTVTAVGDGVTYQWYSSTDNGATYVKSTATCATTKTFSITAAEKWNGLLLKCVVKDASGAKLTTSAAKLTVNSPLAITTQPKSVTANVGDKATFTVAATGTGLTYQWYSCTDGTTYVKSTASCATTNTFTITAATKWNGMQLKCVVRDANGGKITTAAAKLTVVEPLAITTQPKSVTANIGDKASFTVTATGTGLTYQWYSSTDNGATYVKSTATCATTKTFSITAAEKWNGLLLKCVVRDANGGKLTTAAAKLTVNSPLAITAQPKSVTANVGDKASFTVTATGTGLTYQWYSSTDNGATYVKSTAACATTKTFSITAAEKWNGLLLKCVVKDANGGKLTTAAAKLTVAPAFAITAQPKSVAAAAGEKASFTVTATGTGLTYQWYYSTDNGATYLKSTAASATTKTFSITAADKWNGMLLKCVVRDANGGKLTTSAAKLTVATAPTITGQPQNSITIAGAKAEFKVTATGSITGYQWYYSMDDGATWVKSTAACATTNTFSITAAAKWNYMMLKCEVIGQGGTKTTSNFAMLIVR